MDTSVNIYEVYTVHFQYEEHHISYHIYIYIHNTVNIMLHDLKFFAHHFLINFAHFTSSIKLIQIFV